MTEARRRFHEVLRVGIALGLVLSAVGAAGATHDDDRVILWVGEAEWLQPYSATFTLAEPAYGVEVFVIGCISQLAIVHVATGRVLAGSHPCILSPVETHEWTWPAGEYRVAALADSIDGYSGARIEVSAIADAATFEARRAVIYERAYDESFFAQRSFAHEYVTIDLSCAGGVALLTASTYEEVDLEDPTATFDLPDPDADVPDRDVVLACRDGDARLALDGLAGDLRLSVDALDGARGTLRIVGAPWWG